MRQHRNLNSIFGTHIQQVYNPSVEEVNIGGPLGPDGQTSFQSVKSRPVKDLASKTKLQK